MRFIVVQNKFIVQTNMGGLYRSLDSRMALLDSSTTRQVQLFHSPPLIFPLIHSYICNLSLWVLR